MALRIVKDFFIYQSKRKYLHSSEICISILSRSSTSSSSKSVCTVTSRVKCSRVMTSNGAVLSGLGARGLGAPCDSCEPCDSCASCRARRHAAQPQSEPRTRNSHTSPKSAIHVVMLRLLRVWHYSRHLYDTH